MAAQSADNVTTPKEDRGGGRRPSRVLFASGHVVHHEPTCPPDTKVRYGGGGEFEKGTFIEEARDGGGGE